MRVLYQPTQTNNPDGWKTTDSSRWGDVVLAGMPALHAICVQGVTFGGADHYAVRELVGGAIEVAMWHDDPSDWPRGSRHAFVWKFKPLAPSSRPELGGAITPDHELTIYAERDIRENVFKPAYRNSYGVKVVPWSRFKPTDYPAVLHGAWTSEAAHDAHRAKQSVEGWRTWTEGLDASELDENGHVRGQRAQGRYVVPRGTRTYYHNATNLATGVHVALHENELGTSPAGASSETSDKTQGGGAVSYVATTPSNEPDSAAWPTTGVYRYQLDCTAADANATYGVLTQGTASGHFARVNSGLTSELQTFQQDEGAFSGSGLNIASITDPAWSAGAAGDRFEVSIAHVRASGHGNVQITLQLGETDDFADGPWAAAAARRIFVVS